jgi:predicted ribosome quality control (RQC) complex YloA/Tae2 family protein
MQLTDLPRENPAEPPMFCMLLRKYLAGGKILEIKQPPMERLAELVIEASNEMGDKVIRRLILEAMGRRTNLVLLDGEGRIVDCLKRVDVDITQENARPLLPGMFYKYPPSQPGKLDPSALTEEDRAQLLAAGQCDTPADRFLLDHLVGLSPLVAREAAFEAFGEVDAPVGRDPELLLTKVDAILSRLEAGEVQPTMLVREDKPVDFSFRPILQCEKQRILRPVKGLALQIEGKGVQHFCRRKVRFLHQLMQPLPPLLADKALFLEGEQQPRAAAQPVNAIFLQALGVLRPEIIQL